MKIAVIISFLSFLLPLISAEISARGKCPNIKASFWRYKTTATITQTKTFTKTVTRGAGGGSDGQVSTSTVTVPTTLTLIGEPTTCYPLPASCTNRAPIINSGFESSELPPWTFTGPGSGSVVVSTSEDVAFDGDFMFKFGSSPGRLQQTVQLCAGAVYELLVRYRTLVGQETCVGLVGVDGFGEMQTGSEPAPDYDYVLLRFQTTSETPNAAAVFVEWNCVGTAQGELFIDAIEFAIQ